MSRGRLRRRSRSRPASLPLGLDWPCFGCDAAYNPQFGSHFPGVGERTRIVDDAIRVHRNQVQPVGTLRLVHLLEVLAGGLMQERLLSFGDRLLGASRNSPKFDLDEGEGVAIEDHEIELAPPALEEARDDGAPLSPEEFFCAILRLPPFGPAIRLHSARTGSADLMTRARTTVDGSGMGRAPAGPPSARAFRSRSGDQSRTLDTRPRGAACAHPWPSWRGSKRQRYRRISHPRQQPREPDRSGSEAPGRRPRRLLPAPRRATAAPAPSPTSPPIEC